MFERTVEEAKALRSQFATSNSAAKMGLRHPPGRRHTTLAPYTCGVHK